MKWNIVFILLFYVSLAHTRHLSEDTQPIKDKSVPCDGTKDCAVLPPQLPKTSDVVENEVPMRPPAPYQVNHYANTGTLGVGVGYHGGVLYPYVHPDLLAASYIFAPVTSLPPVYATRLPPCVTPQSFERCSRLTRLARFDVDDELLDQLSHDAMMPNIIPTMPVPMGRSYGSAGPHAVVGATALFQAYPGSCGIPILVSCSPNIATGDLESFSPVTEKNKYKQEDLNLPEATVMDDDGERDLKFDENFYERLRTATKESFKKNKTIKSIFKALDDVEDENMNTAEAVGISNLTRGDTDENEHFHKVNASNKENLNN